MYGQSQYGNLITPARGGYNFYKQLRPDELDNIDKKRTALDRIFDALSVGNYVSAGIARGAIRDDMSVVEGIKSGLAAANPFGDGYEQGEHTYSKVLDDMGWQPTSTAGKIARGAVGFVGDIFLDPTTYLSGGTSALVKGTGKTGAKITHKGLSEMTQEIAEDIIKKQATSRGIKLGADDVIRDAEKFTKKYNELIGLRNVDEGVTLSLANAPFGKKIFGKHADASKTLIDGKKLQEIGESTIAPYYSKLRDKIYGGKLGELFSSKSTLYNLSKTQPEAVYDFLKFTEYTRGLTKDVQVMKKAIYEKAKTLNLTPDETKQVIEMMEDKSIWSTVKKYVNFSDTKEAENIRRNINKERTNIQKELDDLLDAKKSLETFNFAKENDLLDANIELDTLREEFKNKLTKLDLSKIEEKSSLEEYIKVIDDELNDLKVKENDFIKSNIRTSKTSDDVVKQYDAFRQAREVGNVEDKVKVYEDVSNYLFGKSDVIAPTAWDGYVDKVVDMIGRGTPDEEIMQYIEKHSDFFNGRASLIYPYVANKIGYKKWDEYYIKPMQELKDKKRLGTLTDVDRQRFAKLKQDELRRTTLLKELKEMDTKDIQKLVENVDVSDIDDMLYSTKTGVDKAQKLRDEKIINDSALNESENMNTASTKNFKIKDANDTLIKTHMRGVAGKYVYEKTLQKVFLDKGKNITDKSLQWASLVADESEHVLQEFFKKDIAELSPAQIDLLIDKSIQNVNNRISNKGMKTTMKDIDRVRLLNEAKRKQQNFRIDNFIKQVKQGATVHLKNVKGEDIQGVVKSLGEHGGKPVMDIIKSDGTVLKNVGFENVSKLRNDIKLFTSEEVVMMSKPAKEFVEKQQSLIKDLETTKSMLNNLDETYKAKYNDLVSDFTYRAEGTKKNIESLERTMQSLQESFENSDFTKIDELTSKIKKIDDALANDDAFETYTRAWLGDNIVDDIIDRNSPVVTKIMLDPNKNVSQKVSDVVTQLRKDLLNIGASEVKIDKLKEEQFVANMYNYLPHMLTDEGKKLFANKEEIIKKMPGFGDDLGYGRKYNQFGKSRTAKFIPNGAGGWIENPNIRQLNEYMQREYGDILKGKNAFQEDIADIYLTRALKNIDLLYDYKYMKTMMDNFGTTLEVGKEIKEGYKAVANYGELREYVRKRASTVASLAIEQMKFEGVKIQKGDFNKLFEENIVKMLDNMGLPTSALDDLGTPMVELTPDQINKIQKIQPNMIKEVNDAIVNKANQARKLQIAKDQSRFLQLYDKFTHIIKLNQTTILPSFHARNKISNTFNNWLAVGVDAVNVDFQKKTFQAMKNGGDIDGVLKITKPDGSIDAIEWRDLFNAAKEYEVLDEGFFAKDIGVGTNTDGMIKQLSPKLDPTDTKNFIGYKKGAEIGGLIEGQDRLLHFASQVSRGMSFEEAAESVNKYLFDYSELTAFEQSIMKRIIPYYTWLRKNSALQLDRMLADPKKYQMVAKVTHGIEGMVDEEDRVNKAFINDFAKDWIQTPFTSTNEDGRTEPILFNPNLPYMDVNRIPNLLDPIGSAKDLFTQVNPLIKTPIEQIINKNVFFDSPIVKEGESQIGKRLDHVLSQHAAYPAAKGFITKRGTDLGLHTLNAATGIKMMSYDYDTYKAMKIQEILDKIEN